MKAVLARVSTGLLVLTVCITSIGTRAGEFEQKQPAAAAVSAQAEKFVSQKESNAEFKFIAKLPESETIKAVTKVSKIKESSVIETRAAKSAVPASDKNVVTLFDFGGNFLYAYLIGMNNLTSRLADTGGEFPEFVFDYNDNNGVHHEIYLGMYFDEANELIIGRDQQGAFAIGFDVDLKQKMIYSTYNGWERNLGFCRLYDMLAPAMGIFYKTERIKFEYNGLDWMVQLWKGSYFAALSGAEMGIYNKPKNRTTGFYDCVSDENMLEMSMRVLKGDKVLVERNPQRHWWMNGFALGGSINLPDTLTLDGSIRFDDSAMKQAFLNAFDKVCAESGITYTVEGNCVSFVWPAAK
jgi:hypothetical protein